MWPTAMLLQLVMKITMSKFRINPVFLFYLCGSALHGLLPLTAGWSGKLASM